mmetsp:Transcript_50095/g.144307  ORF Transcript_50095/g.144307 Transcript_50095/m.144307 type:complete len:352 (+) Transcript_50095:92-1147(+)
MGASCGHVGAMSTCSHALFMDAEASDPMQSPFAAQVNSFLPEKPRTTGPRLALRVVYAPLPVEAGRGSRPSPFAEGDEIAVASLEGVHGWDRLCWRQERSAAGCSGWPPGGRFVRHRRFWGARVIASDGTDGFEEHLCMLQAGVSSTDREIEASRAIADDAKAVAAYAHRFNVHMAQALGQDADPDEIPGVKVMAPVVCEVLGSAVPDIASGGETVILIPYPSPEVQKFVFEGQEDFLELPQAFFHFVAWASGGREFVCDLQGLEDEEGIALVDPAMIRDPAEKPSVGDMLSAVTGLQGADSGGPSEERFNAWHPRCGQACRSFDPQRRSAHVAKRHCGFSAPSCGVSTGV